MRGCDGRDAGRSGAPRFSFTRCQQPRNRGRRRSAAVRRTDAHGSNFYSSRKSPMTAVMTLPEAAPRSIVEERAMRPPTIGRIRPGIKVLKSSARENAKAVNLYETMVAAGSSFDDIAKAIESQCKIREALVPRNVPYFTCRRSDFTNPDVADEILRLYGEDRGEGLKLYRFPVLFAFNDWMSNLPNQMA